MKKRGILLVLAILIAIVGSYFLLLNRYKNNINNIIKDWGNALASLSQTYNKSEYEMFNTLIIRGVPPKKTKWSLQTCYNFRSQVFRDIEKLTKKEDN